MLQTKPLQGTRGCTLRAKTVQAPCHAKSCLRSFAAASFHTHQRLSGLSVSRSLSALGSPRRQLAARTLRVAHVAEPYVKNQTATKEKDEGAKFSWTKQWYPVAAISSVPTAAPHPVKLLGGDFVIWSDAAGSWHCHQDVCPHRLAPLSEGKIVGDSLQCSYHGWRFAADGKCVSIPQATEEQMAQLSSNPRSCVTSFPTTVRYGLIWVWPDAGPGRFVESAMQDVAQEVPPGEEVQHRVRKDGTGTIWREYLPLYVREFPYSMETLFENALDPAHVPWSHHGVIGNRDKAKPFTMDGEAMHSGTVVPLNTELRMRTSSVMAQLHQPFDTTGADDASGEASQDDEAAHADHHCVAQVHQHVTPQGIAVKYEQAAGQASAFGEAGGRTEPDLVTLWFKAPHTLLYDFVRADGTKSKLISYVVPTTPGRCKTYSLSLDTRLSEAKMMSTPVWLAHLIFNKAGDGDLVLLKSQEQLLARPGKSWHDFWLPTGADKLVGLWRNWLDTFTTQGVGPYVLARDSVTGDVPPPPLPKEQLLDRYNQHVKDCKACSAAMKNFGIAVKVARYAAAAVAMLALLAGLGIWNTNIQALLPEAVTAWQLGPQLAAGAALGVAAALCTKLASVLEGVRQQFIFQDYQHAYI